MENQTKRKLMDMLLAYGVRGETDIAQIPFYPQKTECFFSRTAENGVKWSTPEGEGISSLDIQRMLLQLEQHKNANLHTVSVYRHGKLISEATAPGYSTAIWRVTHSMAKTITALAIGQLIDEGKLSLSTKLVDVLGDFCPVRMHKYMREVTVLHLLSMSSGVVGISETTAVVEDRWTSAFLSATPIAPPGTVFKYNSMNTYMLSVILTKITGKTLTEFLAERLFQPMDIRNFLCEKSPEGIEKAGWGMYLSPRDMAKIGQLILQNGKWQGKPLVSEKWMRMMTRKSFQVADSQSAFDYALHIWVAPDHSSYLISGMLGQCVWICPAPDVVAVLTAGNQNIFEKAETLRILADTLGDSKKISKTPLKKSKKDYLALRRTESAFWKCHAFATPLLPQSRIKQLFLRLIGQTPAPLPSALSAFVGNFQVKKNNAGLLPLFCRFMQNNHTQGISSLRLFFKNNRFYVSFMEGVVCHTVEVGFYQRALGELNFGGEPYVVSCLGECAKSEDGIPVLKLDLVFPEHTSCRRVKLFLDGNVLRIELSETPGREMVDDLIAQFVPDTLRGGGIMAFIRAKMFGVDPFTCITPMVEPTLYADKE